MESLWSHCGVTVGSTPMYNLYTSTLKALDELDLSNPADFEIWRSRMIEVAR